MRFAFQSTWIHTQEVQRAPFDKIALGLLNDPVLLEKYTRNKKQGYKWLEIFQVPCFIQRGEKKLGIEV